MNDNSEVDLSEPNTEGPEGWVQNDDRDNSRSNGMFNKSDDETKEVVFDEYEPFDGSDRDEDWETEEESMEDDGGSIMLNLGFSIGDYMFFTNVVLYCIT